MKFTESIFKAYDVRGLVGEELTPEVAEAVGRAFADFLPGDGPVCVGYDMRPDSQELARALKSGIMRQGRKVIDIGQVATDMIYYATGSLKAAGGAQVTASHNPGKYNGIKFCGENAKAISITSGLAEIRDAVATDRYKPEGEGSLEERDVMEGWVDHALSFVDVKNWKPWHIAVDAGNGMAGAVMPHLEGKTPLVVEPLYWELDGTFPNHVANPLIDENNRDLIAKIKSEKLDFGIAFDGDGDRAFLIDERGRTVAGHIMSAMLAKHFLKLYPGSNIVYDARNSRLVEDTIDENGGKKVRSRVGHSFIKEAMRDKDAPFGGEFSGHYYFRDNWYADSGLIGALVAIQVLNDSGKKLSELVDEFDAKYARSPEVNFEVQDKDGKIAEIKKAYADAELDTLDGITVNYPDWWFNVRASNTEPLLRLNMEAKTREQLDRELAKIEKLLKG
ncbi:MAG TPA: phosphomannomutase/phosphoglucomutase [Candidatus Saccharimonadia bacterium]|jgi:phosphomannomutase